jgi:hypothetical protein
VGKEGFEYIKSTMEQVRQQSLPPLAFAKASAMAKAGKL